MTTISKQKYFQDLQEVIQDEIYIGSSVEAKTREISTNMRSISCSQNRNDPFTVEEFQAFFDDLIADRRRKVLAISTDTSVLFYAWFDEQAGQLRFNLLSDVHEDLPFGCRIRKHTTLTPILKQFLKSTTLDGIPFDELIIEDTSPEDVTPQEDIEPPSNFVLDVFVTRLP